MLGGCCWLLCDVGWFSGGLLSVDGNELDGCSLGGAVGCKLANWLVLLSSVGACVRGRGLLVLGV